MNERQQHWDAVYETKAEDDVSWFEQKPQLSLELLAEAGLGPEQSAVDIGGGASRLVDELVGMGQAHVTVLDLSAAALETARTRLPHAGNVDWVVRDVTAWRPERRYDLWHDRAAFHFLTAPEAQASYVSVLAHALVPGGRAIIGTFAPDGPEKCSGLPVARHDAESLAAVLGPAFRLIATRRHDHITPWGAVQKFQFSTFEKP